MASKVEFLDNEHLLGTSSTYSEPAWWKEGTIFQVSDSEAQPQMQALRGETRSGMAGESETHKGQVMISQHLMACLHSP